jgi:hypothetical protein
VICHQNALQLAGNSGGRLNNLGNALTCALRLDEAVSAYRQGWTAAGRCLSGLQPVGGPAAARPLSGSMAAVRTALAHHHAAALPRAPGKARIWGNSICWCGQNKAWAIPCRWHASCPPATAHPDARITLACQTACLRLFGQLEGITLVPLEDAPPAMTGNSADVLPLRLDVTLDTLSDQPYLQADPALWQHGTSLPPRQPAGYAWACLGNR